MSNRKIEDLLNLDGVVYIHLNNADIATQFLKDAEDEGFLFTDGAKPTSRDTSDLFRLYKDKTLCYVNFIGHVAFQCAKEIDGQKLFKIDYQKYLDEGAV